MNNGTWLPLDLLASHQKESYNIPYCRIGDIVLMINCYGFTQCSHPEYLISYPAVASCMANIPGPPSHSGTKPGTSPFIQ